MVFVESALLNLDQSPQQQENHDGNCSAHSNFTACLYI